MNQPIVPMQMVSINPHPALAEVDRAFAGAGKRVQSPASFSPCDLARDYANGKLVYIDDLPDGDRKHVALLYAFALAFVPDVTGDTHSISTQKVAQLRERFQSVPEKLAGIEAAKALVRIWCEQNQDTSGT